MDTADSAVAEVDADVVVVGAGPVGLMLACELRLGGARVIVLESLVAPTTESRASTLHARTLEFFDQRGLLDQLGSPPVQSSGHFGGIPLDFSGLPTRFPGQYKVLQAQVEEVLARRATALGADIRREHEVCGLEAGADTVRVRARTPAGLVGVVARYVVGCDGEDSTVRVLSGIDFPGAAGTHELLRADITGIEIADRRFERLPEGLAIASRLPNGATRVMVSVFGRPVVSRMGAPEFDEICSVWQQVTGDDIAHGTPIWRNAFDDTSRLAGRLRSGRILLAGDAAHVQMPSGGQAINLGLQDAANLGWKLAAVATGAAPEDLLETYHEERHEIARRVLGNIRAQGLLLLGGPEVDATRTVLRELIAYPEVNDRLAAMIAGIDVRYAIGGGEASGTGADRQHSPVGAAVPHVELAVTSTTAAAGAPGTDPASTAALLRSGQGVLLDLADCAGRHEWLSGRLAPYARRVDLVAATLPAADGGGVFAGWETVLVRPDGYVAWVGDRYSDPGPAVDFWFGSASGGGVSGSVPGVVPVRVGSL
ncbi:oxygenase/bifunctional oxygenase/reductase [Actinacidiphila paucisporea]|uniref:Oxygenase/bifunctional oxygenase/reductase n=1 Tax=Actinacidiphila paucisporea TaxID=310782 RepID=A0A1M7Q3R4_9ACTN|nr:oxygenase/bifunctional oxygenase/reductase [Actinacidiphila paucisporea]